MLVLFLQNDLMQTHVHLKKTTIIISCLHHLLHANDSWSCCKMKSTRQRKNLFFLLPQSLISTISQSFLSLPNACWSFLTYYFATSLIFFSFSNAQLCTTHTHTRTHLHTFPDTRALINTQHRYSVPVVRKSETGDSRLTRADLIKLDTLTNLLVRCHCVKLSTRPASP